MEDIGLGIALRRTFQKGSSGIIPYCLPFLIVEFSFRVITMFAARYSGRSAGWIDIVLLFVVAYPVNFLADVLVARIYLQRDVASSASLRFRAALRVFRSDIWLLIARVAVRCIAWLFAMIGFVIAEYLSVVIFMKLSHHGNPHDLGKTINHVMLEIAIVFYEGICSRYSFVAPLYAFRELWQNDWLVDGVRLARERWRILWALAMAVTAVLLLSQDVSKWALIAVPASRAADRALRVVQLTLAAVLTGYFTVLKTELMRRASSVIPDMSAL